VLADSKAQSLLNGDAILSSFGSDKAHNIHNQSFLEGGRRSFYKVHVEARLMEGQGYRLLWLLSMITVS